MAAPPLRGSWCSSTAAPLRASWFPPAAAAAASNSARPVRPKVMHINSPVRRDVYPATVRIQARTRDAFRSHCHKGADQYPEPEPEPEQEDVNEHNSADSDSSENSARNNPLLEQLRRDREALRALMGVRVPPDMFVEEKDQINSYKMYSLGADILNANEKALAELACARALTALDLSSKVMDIASSGFGTSEISVHTTNQMVRTYSATFLEVAKDAYLKRLEIEAVIPFLGALRAVCHISIESVLDRLKDGPLKDSIPCHMDGCSREFERKLENLKYEFTAATRTRAYKIVPDILYDGIKHAEFYITRLGDWGGRAALPLPYDKD